MPDLLASPRTGEDILTDVIVIGTGFSGLGMAVALRREGKRDFVMLERAQDVGGTWRENSYPGAACDIQSHLYSYSFRPNPRWSRVYAPQPEILDYLRATAEEEELLPHIRFGANVERAAWDAGSHQWIVTTTAGRFRGPVLISAAGHLSDPSLPDIPGLDRFAGTMFHSAKWDHGWDAAGQRVAIIGTGASAIQIVPEIAKRAGHLTVFQRSAPYIIPRRDHIYSDAEKGMFERLPETAQELRDELFWGNESRFPQRRGIPAFINPIATMAQQHLEAQVADPVLRDKLTPRYTLGCKRVLISNDYYPTLALPRVTLETEGIARIDGNDVVLRDGRVVTVDALIIATGFEATELPIAEVIYGENDRQLAHRWTEGGQAYACTTVSGFPNLFLMLGPNTGLGAGSIIFMVETQIEYIRGAIDFIFEGGQAIHPHPNDERDYVDSIYQRAEGSVWLTGGCSSWYLHPASGRLTTLWPDFMSQFRAENGRFSSAGYVVRPNPAAVEGVA